jgi:hypothetical protein
VALLLILIKCIITFLGKEWFEGKGGLIRNSTEWTNCQPQNNLGECPTEIIDRIFDINKKYLLEIHNSRELTDRCLLKIFEIDCKRNKIRLDKGIMIGPSCSSVVQLLTFQVNRGCDALVSLSLLCAYLRKLDPKIEILQYSAGARVEEAICRSLGFIETGELLVYRLYR